MHRIVLLAVLVLAAIAVVGGVQSSTRAQDEPTPLEDVCASPVASPDAAFNADGTPVGLGTPVVTITDLPDASPVASPDPDEAAQAATVEAIDCGTPAP